jgi:hypothetical protein
MTVTALQITTAHAASGLMADEIDEVLKDTAKYLYQTVEEAQVGSIGGEWAVIGLARSGTTFRTNGSKRITTIWKNTRSKKKGFYIRKSTPIIPA